MEELGAAVQALGQDLTLQEVYDLAHSVHADDGSGLGFAEFCVFMKPFLSIANRQEFAARRVEDNLEVAMQISPIGIRLHPQAGRASGSTTSGGRQHDPWAVQAALSHHSRTAGLLTGEADDIGDSVIGFATVLDFAVAGSVVTLRRADGSSVRFDSPEAENVALCLERNQTLRKLRRAVQTHKEKEKLRAAFNELDTSGDGLLDITELRLLLRVLGQSMSDLELIEKTGHKLGDTVELSFEQFAELLTAWQEAELADVFRFFDDTDSGFISLEEMQTAMLALIDLTPEDAVSLASFVDSDGSGSVDHDEFALFMRPMMSFSERLEFSVRSPDGQASLLEITPLGLEVKSAGAPDRFYTVFAIVECVAIEDPHGIRLTVTEEPDPYIFRTNDSAAVVATLRRQQAKLALRKDIEMDKQQRQLREVFREVDTDGSGSIQQQELEQLMEMLGHNISDTDIANHMAQADSDMSFDDFVSWMTELQEQEIQDAFLMYDEDESGTIDVSELRSLIALLGQPLPEEQIRQLAKNMDEDGSGDIGFHEFKALVRPMLSLSSHGSFPLPAHPDLRNLTINGLGVELGAYVYPFESVASLEATTSGISLVVKPSQGDTNAVRVAKMAHGALKLEEGQQVFNLHVRGVGSSTDRELVHIFGQHGACLQATVRRKQDSAGNDKSWAIVTMADEAGSEAALAATTRIGDQVLSVQRFSKGTEAMAMTSSAETAGHRVAELAESSLNATDGQDVFHLHVRGVRSSTDRELMDVFSQHGECLQAAVRRKCDDAGRDKSWAIVTMKDEAGYESALASTTTIGEWHLTVKPFSRRVARNQIGRMDVVTDAGDEIVAAFKKQAGALALRAAVARSKEPNDSGLETALMVLRTAPQKRTDKQLKMLQLFLNNHELFDKMDIEYDMQKVQCCRYISATRYLTNDRIMEEGEMSMDVMVIIQGNVSLRCHGVEVRQMWEGATFGALHISGEEDFVGDLHEVVAVSPCVVARLARVDYLRICSALSPEVARILQSSDRTAAELDIVAAYFDESSLFQKLYWPSMQAECCRRFACLTADEGSVVVSRGDRDDKLLTLQAGTVEEAAHDGSKHALEPGSSVGLSCLLSASPEEQCHTATVSSITGSTWATLHRSDFESVCEVGEKVMNILEKPSAMRKKREVDATYAMLRNTDIIKKFPSRLIQLHCCRFLVAVHIGANEYLYKQGDVGTDLFIVLTGLLSVEKWRGGKNKRGAAARRGESARPAGTTFGEASLTAKTEFERHRKESVRATSPSVLAMLTQHHYERLMSSIAIPDSIERLWDMAMNTQFREQRSNTPAQSQMCDAETYRLLHLALSKALQPTWSDALAEQEATKDWRNDLGRQHLDLGKLSHDAFVDGVFELIDAWCDKISMSMFASFIDQIHDHISKLWRRFPDDPERAVEQFVIADRKSLRSIWRKPAMKLLMEKGEAQWKIDMAEDKKVMRRLTAAKMKQDKDKEADADAGGKAVERGLGMLAAIRLQLGAAPSHKAVKADLLASRQLALLQDEFGCSFESVELSEMFKEMLVMRADHNTWSRAEELRFRSQLSVNLAQGDRGTVAVVLDRLQQGYLAGEPPDLEKLAVSTGRAEQVLHDLERRLEVTIDGHNREVAIARVLRKNQGDPYWLPEPKKPSDDERDLIDLLKALVDHRNSDAPTSTIEGQSSDGGADSDDVNADRTQTRVRNSAEGPRSDSGDRREASAASAQRTYQRARSNTAAVTLADRVAVRSTANTANMAGSGDVGRRQDGEMEVTEEAELSMLGPDQQLQQRARAEASAREPGFEAEHRHRGLSVGTHAAVSSPGNGQELSMKKDDAGAHPSDRTGRVVNTDAPTRTIERQSAGGADSDDVNADRTGAQTRVLPFNSAEGPRSDSDDRREVSAASAQRTHQRARPNTADVALGDRVAVRSTANTAGSLEISARPQTAGTADIDGRRGLGVDEAEASRLVTADATHMNAQRSYRAAGTPSTDLPSEWGGAGQQWYPRDSVAPGVANDRSSATWLPVSHWPQAQAPAPAEAPSAIRGLVPTRCSTDTERGPQQQWSSWHSTGSVLPLFQPKWQPAPTPSAATFATRPSTASELEGRSARGTFRSERPCTASDAGRTRYSLELATESVAKSALLTTRRDRTARALRKVRTAQTDTLPAPLRYRERSRSRSMRQRLRPKTLQDLNRGRLTGVA